MRNSKLMLMAGMCICAAILGGLAQAQQDVIYLEVSPCSECVRPGEMIDVAVKVKNLQQRIHQITAKLKYTGAPCGDSGPAGSVCVEKVQPGEPFWTDVLISINNAETDFIMGLQPPEFKAVGTIADNTVARIRLKACTQGNVTLSITGKAYVAPNCVVPGSPQPATVDLTPGPEVAVCIDDTPPTVAITAINQAGCQGNLLLAPCPCTLDCPTDGCCLPGSCDSTVCAGPGDVTITVTAGDVCACKDLRPSVQVITACGTLTDITCRQQGSSGNWTFTFTIDNDTEPGLAMVRAQVTDCAGNVSLEALGTFQICPVLTIRGLVELQGFSGSLREVYFTVNDGATDTPSTFIQVLQFSRMQCFPNLVGAYVLHVPGLKAGEVVSVQAKTAWNLSGTQVIVAGNQCCGCLVVNFTGASLLLAGDLATQDPCLRFKLGDEQVDSDDVAFVDNAVGEAINYYNYWADVNGDGIVTEDDKQLVLQNFGMEAATRFVPRP